MTGLPSAIKRGFKHIEMLQKQRERRAQKHLFDSINNHKRTESKHQPLYGVLVDLGGK